MRSAVLSVLTVGALLAGTDGFVPTCAPLKARTNRGLCAGTSMSQESPPTKLSLPKAKLNALEINRKQWGIDVKDDMGSEAQGADLEPREFLRVLMSSRAAQSEKATMLERARQLRFRKGEDRYFAFLNLLLNEVDSVSDNKWAMIQWPVPLPSYRAKLGSLNRMLDQLLKDGMDENVRREGVRARSLALLIRQLETCKGVRALEKEAQKAKTEESMAEMLKRTPPGLETPKYEVVSEKGTWEVRKYEDFSVCSFNMQSAPEKSGFGAFNALAGYIFGGNQEQVKMAMTTPVINHGQSRKMSFIMPSSYWKADASPPTPMADSGVKLESKGGGMVGASPHVAIMWFGGFASKDVVAQKKSLLKANLAQDADWKAVDDTADPLLLQYNDPFVPPWKRRNEIALAVASRVAPSASSASSAAPTADNQPTQPKEEEEALMMNYAAKLAEVCTQSTKTLEKRLLG